MFGLFELFGLAEALQTYHTSVEMPAPHSFLPYALEEASAFNTWLII
jgi:hypothetical protein